MQVNGGGDRDAAGSRSGRFAGRVALVTGTGGGIGRAIAAGLAREGAAVVCAGLDEAANAETVEAIRRAGGRATFVRTDVRSAGDNARMAQEAIDRYGGIDVVVNNAGLTLRSRIHEMPEEDWDAVFDTNVKGVYHAARAVMPHFLERGAGTMVVVASTFGILGAPEFAAYCASKGALITLVKQMALDYGPAVRVNAICPGATDAPQVRRYIDSTPDPAATEAQIGGLNAALRRMAEPEEIADAALFLASDDARFVTGHALVVDGGQTIDA